MKTDSFELPALPAGWVTQMSADPNATPAELYFADDMRDYARSAIAAHIAQQGAEPVARDWAQDAREWGNALNSAGWEFDGAYRRHMGEHANAKLFNMGKTIIRDVILKYAEKVIAKKKCDTPRYCASVQRCTADDERRASSAVPPAPQVAQAVPGWCSIMVNAASFDKLIAAMDRAERKGYLPDAVVDEWLQFDYKTAAPVAQPATEQAEAPIARKELTVLHKGDGEPIGLAGRSELMDWLYRQPHEAIVRIEVFDGAAATQPTASPAQPATEARTLNNCAGCVFENALENTACGGCVNSSNRQPWDDEASPAGERDFGRAWTYALATAPKGSTPRDVAELCFRAALASKQTKEQP